MRLSYESKVRLLLFIVTFFIVWLAQQPFPAYR